MYDKNYAGNLCNWPAVASRFDLDRAEPPFAFVLLESDGERYIELGIWSDDGHRFSFAAAEGACRAGQERIIGPHACSAKRLREKLARLCPLLQPHLAEIAAWRRRVGVPHDLPRVVEVLGPKSGMLRVIRNGLGLSGDRLAEALRYGGRLQVSPTQFFALQFWSQKLPGVSVRRALAGDPAYLAAG